MGWCCCLQLENEYLSFLQNFAIKLGMKHFEKMMSLLWIQLVKRISEPIFGHYPGFRQFCNCQTPDSGQGLELFSTQNFFGPKFLLDQNIFGPKIFLDPKFFWIFFYTKRSSLVLCNKPTKPKSFEPKTVFDPNFFDPKIF